jgi:hypothetical protein
VDWKEEKYNEVFEACLLGLKRQREIDPSFTPDSVRGVLRHLYIQDGNDWGGRGELQDIQIQATIAAHEYFLSEWETEHRQDD